MDDKDLNKENEENEENVFSNPKEISLDLTISKIFDGCVKEIWLNVYLNW